ncbi:MAG: trigger factor [Clostridia bacterium]|nr:trigger factor [Clostridia bacterium]
MSLDAVNQVEANVLEITVSADAEQFEAACQKAYNKARKKIAIPGFRKGKATRKMVERVYGEGVFYEDALDILYPEIVGEALEGLERKAVAAPYDLDVKKIGKEGLELVMKVVVEPEVEVGEYKGIKAKKKAVRVTEKEINEEIAKLQERNSTIEAVEDKEAAEGDICDIAFEGFVDGEAFDGGQADNFDLTLGSGQFIPGFEDQIVGHKAGDEFDVVVTFPEDYGAENLAGKEATFKVKLHEAKVKVLPELDDEFAKDVSEFDTLDELKADEKKKIKENKQKEAENDFENAVIDALIEGMKAEIPQQMIDARIDENLKQFEQNLQMQGLNLETYVKYTGGDVSALRESLKPQSERQVKIRLCLDKIAALENIEVTEEEIDAEMQKYADAYKVELDVIKAAIPVDDVKADLAAEKAMNLVKENCKA